MTTEKKPTTNSNTQHSKELRQKTSDAWLKKNTKSILVRFNMQKDEDVNALELFKSIPAKSNTLKLKALLEHYFK